MAPAPSNQKQRPRLLAAVCALKDGGRQQRLSSQKNASTGVQKLPVQKQRASGRYGQDQEGAYRSPRKLSLPGPSTSHQTSAGGQCDSQPCSGERASTFTKLCSTPLKLPLDVLGVSGSKFWMGSSRQNGRLARVEQTIPELGHASLE